MRRSNYVETDHDTNLACMSHTETKQQETQDVDQESKVLHAKQNQYEQSKVVTDDAEAHTHLTRDEDQEMNREHTETNVAKRQNVDVVN